MPLDIDLEQSKLKMASRMGADQTFLATGPELPAKLKAATGGHGPDIAVEFVGAQKSVLEHFSLSYGLSNFAECGFS